jgi:hypothetical protein
MTREKIRITQGVDAWQDCGARLACARVGLCNASPGLGQVAIAGSRERNEGIQLIARKSAVPVRSGPLRPLILGLALEDCRRIRLSTHAKVGCAPCAKCAYYPAADRQFPTYVHVHTVCAALSSASRRMPQDDENHASTALTTRPVQICKQAC